MNATIDIKIASENALIIYFKQQISAQNSQIIQAFTLQIRDEFKPLIIDLVPSYASILLVFNTNKISHQALTNALLESFSSLQQDINKIASHKINLPVYYGDDVAWDLDLVSEKLNLSKQDIINMHSSQTYHVYAIGFAPGFAYLGELDQQLCLPRMASPRLKVPKGAVAIADRQTAIYPAESPGGWHIIGRCPTPLFELDKTPTMPFSVGSEVSFTAISKQQFLDMGGSL